MSILESLRDYSGLTQAQLSKKSGVSRTTLQKYEKNDNFGNQELDKLSSTLARFVDLSYVAGLFDRKSTIQILKVNPVKKKVRYNKTSFSGWTQGPGYIVRIEFMTKYKLLANILKKVFGCGSLTSVTDKYGHVNWIYMAWSRNGRKVIDQLLPYLRLKRPQALIIKSLGDLQDANRSLRGKIKPGDLSKYRRTDYKKRVKAIKDGMGPYAFEKKFKVSNSNYYAIRRTLENQERRNIYKGQYQDYLKKAEALKLKINKLNRG